MIKRFYIILLLFFVVLIGCDHFKCKSHNSDEGIISYRVEYNQSENENPLIAILPQKTELCFKDNNISLTSKGYLGVFSTKIVSVFNKYNYILISVLGKKLKYRIPLETIPFIYNQPQAKRIVFSDSSKNIAGYQCKMATVYFEDTIPPFVAFYTKKINLSDPNRNTPYNPLNAVLLEFEMDINNIRTKFIADKVELIKIDSSEFRIPESYEDTDLEALQKYVIDFK